MLSGRCHCGAVVFEVTGAPRHTALCHCEDCRRAAGAPVVCWSAFDAAALRIVKGEPTVYASSAQGRRHFCGSCGAGLFYYNEEALPGIVDIQTAAFDNPGALAPTIQIQTAERISWMKTAHDLPAFERFPG